MHLTLSNKITRLVIKIETLKNIYQQVMNNSSDSSNVECNLERLLLKSRKAHGIQLIPIYS